MQELRLVAVSEDGTYLVLATAGRGTRFTLPVDDRLRAAVRGHFSRLGQFEIEVENPLRPKEIQARIRSGETAEEIAESAGIPVERVRWFEGPVLQEREYMAQQAQRVTVRRPGESTPGPPLGETVEERLGRGGVDLEEVEWDSWKCEDSTWRVRLSFFDNGRPHAAEWVFDPRRRHVSPLDEVAARLTSVEWDDDALSDTVTPLVPRRPAMKVVSDGRDLGPGRGLPSEPEQRTPEQRAPEPAPEPLRAAEPREYAEPRGRIASPHQAFRPKEDEPAREIPVAPAREAAPRERPAAPPREVAAAAPPAPVPAPPKAPEREPEPAPAPRPAAAAPAPPAPAAPPRPAPEVPREPIAAAPEPEPEREEAEEAVREEPAVQAVAEPETAEVPEPVTDDVPEELEEEEAPEPVEAAAAVVVEEAAEEELQEEPEPPRRVEAPKREAAKRRPAAAPREEPRDEQADQADQADQDEQEQPAEPRQPARPPAKKKPAARPSMPAAAQSDQPPAAAAAAGDGPAGAPRPARGRRKAKGKRASVPSWDEIMFGARRPE